MAVTFLSYRRPQVSTFTETGVDNGGTVYYEFPAKLPDTNDFLAFVSYETNSDHRGLMLAFESISSSDGWRFDDNSSDTYANPEIDFSVNGDTDKKFVSTGNYTIGDRMNMLISGTIASSVATCQVVIWDATSGTSSLVYDVDSAASATAFDWERHAVDPPALLASYSGSREADVTMYRFAYWDDADLGGAPPDITSSGVQDNFFNSSTGALVDPATSHTAYGTPLYDAYGSLADWNAGTNKGSGSDWTKQGGSFT